MNSKGTSFAIIFPFEITEHILDLIHIMENSSFHLSSCAESANLGKLIWS